MRVDSPATKITIAPASSKPCGGLMKNHHLMPLVVESAPMRRVQPSVVLLILFVMPLNISFAQSAKQQPTQEQSHKPKLAELIVSPGSVYATGVWRPDNLTKKNEPVEAAVEITCFAEGGKPLVGTEAFCLQVTA